MLAAALGAASGLASCGGSGGGGSDGDGGGSGGTAIGEPGSFTVVDLGTHAFDEVITVYGANFAATGPISFTLAGDTVSFAILTDLSGTGSLGFVGSLIGPDGRDLTPGGSFDAFLDGPLRPLPDLGATGLLVPKTTTLNPQAGTYTFRLYRFDALGGTAPARVAVRRGSPAGRRVPVNFMVHRQVNVTTDVTDGAIEFLRGVYLQAGIDLSPVSVVTDVGNFTNAVITDTDPGGPIESLFSNRGPNPDGLTFYLLRDVELGGASLFGASSGIPGSMGFPLPTDNGVLISLAAHLVPDGAGTLAVDVAEMGTTMAHEGGHWLGLNHTTEKSGDLFDPVADTPECPVSQDGNGNGNVDPDECAFLGRDNLMFWTGSQNVDLSSQQIQLLQRAPIIAP